MDTKTLITVITSAAIGTIIAAGISLFGQFFERRARRQELLLTKAIDLAHARIAFGREMADAMKIRTTLPPPLTLAAEYYSALRYLLARDKLPAKLVEDARKSLETVEKKWTEEDRALPPG